MTAELLRKQLVDLLPAEGVGLADPVENKQEVALLDCQLVRFDSFPPWVSVQNKLFGSILSINNISPEANLVLWSQ